MTEKEVRTWVEENSFYNNGTSFILPFKKLIEKRTVKADSVEVVLTEIGKEVGRFFSFNSDLHDIFPSTIELVDRKIL